MDAVADDILITIHQSYHLLPEDIHVHLLAVASPGHVRVSIDVLAFGFVVNVMRSLTAASDGNLRVIST